MFNLKVDKNLKVCNSNEELLELIYDYKYNHKININIEFETNLREYKKSKVKALKNSYEENIALKDTEKFIKAKEIELSCKMKYEINNIISTFFNNKSISDLFDERDILLEDKCESLRSTINYYISKKLLDDIRPNIDCYINPMDNNSSFSFRVNDESKHMFETISLSTVNPYEVKVTELNINNIKNIVVPAYTYFLTINYNKEEHQFMVDKCKCDNDKDRLLKDMDKINNLFDYYIGIS